MRWSYFGKKFCLICPSWVWPTLLLTGFRFKSQIKLLKMCTVNPLAMSWKQFYTSVSYLRTVEFIVSLGHRWNELVSHNLVCNKFISWSQNYCTTQLNLAWRNWSLEMETQRWILRTKVHFQSMKKCDIPRQPILSSKMLCMEMASFLLSSLHICTTLWLYDRPDFENSTPRNTITLESQHSLQKRLCRHQGSF